MKIYTTEPVKIKNTGISSFPLLTTLHDINQNNYRSSESFEIVNSVTECDVAIISQTINFYFKHDLTHIPEALVKEAQAHHKPVWGVHYGDRELRPIYKNVYLFQNAINPKRSDQYNHIIPSWISDPYLDYDREFEPMAFTEKPKIGFCGYATNSIQELIQGFRSYFIHVIFLSPKHLYPANLYFPAHVRHKYLKFFETLKQVDANIIYREKYRAGGDKNPKLKAKTTKEFFDNIYENQYTLCLRGGGNFSVRFFQTIAMGRIPIFIDLNSTFPFREVIQEQNLIPILKKGEEKKWEQQINEFHQSWKSNFEELQLKLRAFWKEYYQKDSFFKNFYQQHHAKVKEEG